MSRRCARQLLLGFAASLFVLPAASAAAPEDTVKLAFAYNAARFVTWPHDGASDTPAFRLCVIGTELQRIASDNLSSRSIGKRKIRVIDLDDTDNAAAACDLVYIPADAADLLRDVVDNIHESPVLSVSDAEGFAEAGGIIELRRVADRIALRINVDASRRAGLAISSQLLALASVVSKPVEDGE